MNIAALITWVVTALGGFYLIGTWITTVESGRTGPAGCPSPSSSATSCWPRPGSWSGSSTW